MAAKYSTWKNYSFNKLVIEKKIKNPTVLAFSAYFHDSSACIVKNGKIIATADEERFTRKKHDANFPENAIKYCLKEAGDSKIDAVVFYEDPDIKWERINEMIEASKPRKEIRDKIMDLWKNVKSREKIQEKFENAIGLKNKIIFLDHHLSHDMRDVLNAKVKHRELFRPFAPVVCIDDAPTYFECDNPIPEPTDYMLMVYPIKKDKQKSIPAVTHVDGSGRLQTIRRGQNSLYYDLIKEFGKISGVPILVNTSFNIRGEPIVCAPHDAYKCMMGTEIDCLVIGKFLVNRKDNPKDMWNAEAKE